MFPYAQLAPPKSPIPCPSCNGANHAPSSSRSIIVLRSRMMEPNPRVNVSIKFKFNLPQFKPHLHQINPTDQTSSVCLLRLSSLPKAIVNPTPMPITGRQQKILITCREKKHSKRFLYRLKREVRTVCPEPDADDFPTGPAIGAKRSDWIRKII